ncbi:MULTISPECIES: GAF domain-containing protein [Streptomyces]|uniref:GAF domain-containing protein n=1 Tax=Streptomyces sp. SYP-A7185 TaxID=3040076 RepID=UPI0038F7B6C2
MVKKIWATLRAIAFVLLPVVSPGLTFFCGSQLASSHGAMRWLFIALGVLFAIMAPWTTRLTQTRDRRNAVIKNEAVISAVANQMGTLATEPENREATLATIHNRLTDCAAQHAGSKARAGFFALRNKKQLRLVSHYNRDTKPSQLDRRDEERLVNAMNGKEIVYTKDTLNADGNLNVSLGDSYRSAIAAPVYAGNEAQGVLLIDAPDPSRLTKKHVRESYIRAITHLLGTAHAMGESDNGRVVPRQPGRGQNGKATPTPGKEE